MKFSGKMWLMKSQKTGLYLLSRKYIIAKTTKTLGLFRVKDCLKFN